MTHWLRHLAARLWISLVIGTAATFGAMILLQPAIGLEAAPVVAAAMMSGVFFVGGWAAGRLGRWRLRRLLSAAEEAERDGLRIAAAALFDRARAALDSFLISPAVRRRRLPALQARLARFHLAGHDGYGARAAFIRRYLMGTPGDTEVAEQWVAALERYGAPAEEELDLAARLAAAHPRHAQIQPALARIYLAQEATDPPALQCYRRVCSGEETPDPGLCHAVAGLLRSSACNAEWARQLVHRFCGAAPPLREPAPLVAPLPSESAASQVRAVAAADPVASDDEDGGLFRMSAFPDEPEDAEETEERPRPRKAATAAIPEGAGRLAAAARRRTAALGAGLRTARWSRPAVLCGLGAVLLAGGLWFCWDDILRLREDTESPPAAALESAPSPVVMERFALQVAAYLKAEHAHKFVDQLKRQGIDAYLTETVSGGKTWYQVRIAPFADRQSARDFGSRLKQKGLIEDFYVTLYSR